MSHTQPRQRSLLVRIITAPFRFVWAIIKGIGRLVGNILELVGEIFSIFS